MFSLLHFFVQFFWPIIIGHIKVKFPLLSSWNLRVTIFSNKLYKHKISFKRLYLNLYISSPYGGLQPNLFPNPAGHPVGGLLQCRAKRGIPPKNLVRSRCKKLRKLQRNYLLLSTIHCFVGGDIFAYSGNLAELAVSKQNWILFSKEIIYNLSHTSLMEVGTMYESFL